MLAESTQKATASKTVDAAQLGPTSPGHSPPPPRRTRIWCGEHCVTALVTDGSSVPVPGDDVPFSRLQERTPRAPLRRPAPTARRNSAMSVRRPVIYYSLRSLTPMAMAPRTRRVLGPTASKTWEPAATTGCEVEGEGRLSANPGAPEDVWIRRQAALTLDLAAGRRCRLPRLRGRAPRLSRVLGAIAIGVSERNDRVLTGLRTDIAEHRLAVGAGRRRGARGVRSCNREMDHDPGTGTLEPSVTRAVTQCSTPIGFVAEAG